MKNILITGASGFIGHSLVKHLSQNHRVFALIRSQSQVVLNQYSDSVTWINTDLSLLDSCVEFPKKIDAVIHLAQSRLYRNFPEEVNDIFNVNVRSTLKLLEYARRADAETFVIASSGGVYGYGYEKFIETDSVNPLNFYLSSKYAAELLVANYQQFFNTIVFRFFFVYGPNQERMLIPSLVNKVLNRETIRIEGNPGLLINPIHVDDVVDVFQPALNLNKSEIFNIAGNEKITISGLVDTIEELAKQSTEVICDESLPSKSLVGDISKLANVLQIQPKRSLVDGLSEMIECHKLKGI